MSARTKKIVLVRTYSAGIHFGELVSRKGTEATLRNSRRIWRWRGANTLNEIAASGIEPASKGWSRVSKPTPGEHILTDVIEVIAMSPSAAKSIAACGWAK